MDNIIASNKKNYSLVGYTLLGKYETKNDLINFKGRFYQPQITINAKLAESKFHEMNIVLDKENGFTQINVSNQNENKATDAIQFESAIINAPDGTQYYITVNEARRFIQENYECFVEQNDPIGHRCYY